MAIAVPLSRFTSLVGGGSAFFVRPLAHMTFKKPSSEVAFATVLYIVFGAYGTYMGIRDSSLYMMLICPILVLLSCGVWFQSKPAAVALIVISIVFTLVGLLSLVTGHFGVHLLVRVIAQIYVTVVLWLWVKGIEI